MTRKTDEITAVEAKKVVLKVLCSYKRKKKSKRRQKRIEACIFSWKEPVELKETEKRRI